MGYEEVISTLEAYSRQVVEHYHPNLIVLYGSYARGTATEDSDIDVAVICDVLSGDFLESAAGLFRLRRDIDLRIEPVLIGPDAVDSGFYRHILETGKIIYAKSA